MSTRYTLVVDGTPKGVYADQVSTGALVKMAIYVHRPLHRRIKTIASLRGISMSEYVQQAVLERLNRDEGRAEQADEG